MLLRLGNYAVSIRKHRLIKDVVGMQSICSDGSHVLFLDMDKAKLEDCVQTCKMLQRNYKLSDFYIFESSSTGAEGNYHALCLDKLSFGMIVEIQMMLGMKKYVIYSVRRGYWVLRLSSKGMTKPPKYVMVVPGYSSRKKSRSHYLWVKSYIDMKPNNLDSSEGLVIDTYVTEQKKKEGDDLLQTQ